MDVRFVTSNEGKFREVRALLAPFGIRTVRVRRTLPEPQADGLARVVRAKLEALPPHRTPTIVEDSGLFIHALNGFPGVYSAHVYRIWGFGPLLELLRRRPRRAVFRTVAGVRRDGETRLFTGECDGRIALRAKGSGGFGFDPIFVPGGMGRTFAELPPSEKNLRSHRARAFRKVGRYLTK
jgi:XTP/dITP diphosphohydrolase